VDEVIVYLDRPHDIQDRDADLLLTILKYMETPQYIRKYLFDRIPQLRYAGILPPLRTPHHPLVRKRKELRHDEHRDGVVIASQAGQSLVELGVERPIRLNENGLPIGQRITLRVSRTRQGVGIERVSAPPSKIYWGYRVNDAKPTLRQLLRVNAFDLVVATSRGGKPLTEALTRFRNDWRNAHRVLIAIGSPREGLNEILAREGLTLEDVAHVVLNTIPFQGTETVRTEEALYATLAVVNAVVRGGPLDGTP
jgi:predicted SPOUT superfamily RNA methylase MTH1